MDTDGYLNKSGVLYGTPLSFGGTNTPRTRPQEFTSFRRSRA